MRSRAVLSSSRVLVVKSELIRRRESTAERPFLFGFFSFHLKMAAPVTNIILICAALYIMPYPSVMAIENAALLQTSF